MLDARALLVSMLLSAAVLCARTDVNAVADQPAAGPLTLSLLRNFTYDLGESSSVDGGKVPLVDGQWADPKGGSRFSLLPIHAIGDLDRDGAADAVVVVGEASGSTGSFSYMFAILNRNGRPMQPSEPEWLGDRTVVQRVAIDRKGVVSIRFVTHQQGDAACCPTLKIDDRYRVEGGKLIGITK